MSFIEPVIDNSITPSLAISEKTIITRSKSKISDIVAIPTAKTPKATNPCAYGVSGSAPTTDAVVADNIVSDVTGNSTGLTAHATPENIYSIFPVSASSFTISTVPAVSALSNSSSRTIINAASRSLAASDAPYASEGLAAPTSSYAAAAASISDAVANNACIKTETVCVWN